MHYVYILKNKGSKSLYIGYSSDLKQRFRQHKLTKDVRLIYYEAYLSKKDACEREQKLKMYGSAWRGLKQRLETSLKQGA